jgi:hypothetical protein
VRTSVLAAYGLNLRTLFATLQGAGVEEGWVITDNAGESLLYESPPDFVIAVLNPQLDPTLQGAATHRAAPDFSNLDVAIRAGQAAGQGYPVLLIAPPPLAPPADLPGVVVALCPLDDPRSLRLHVWAFVSTLPQRTPDLAMGPPHDPSEAFDAQSIIETLDSIDGAQPTPAMKVEQLIAVALKQAGAELVENADRRDRANQVDLAFLPSRGAGDVVLVEIRAGRLTQQGLSRAEERLQRYVIERQAGLGVLIYHDFEGKNLPARHTTPLVVRLSARQLIAGLATDTLPRLLERVVGENIRRL